MRIRETGFRGFDLAQRRLIGGWGVIGTGIVLFTPIELEAAGATNQPVMMVLTNGVAQLDAAAHWFGFSDTNRVPDFLIEANLVAAAIYVILIGIQFLRLKTTDRTPLPEDGLAVAAMTGGAQRVVQAAITSLARSGSILLGGPNGVTVMAMSPLWSEANELERAVYNVLAESDGMRVLELVDKAERLTAVQEIAWKAPVLAEPKRGPVWFGSPFRVLSLIAFGLAGYRFYLHYEEGTLGQALQKGGIQLIGIGLLLLGISQSDLTNTRQFSPQRRRLNRLKKAHPDTGSALSTRTDPRDWAMAVAVHGPYALSGTPLADYVVQFGYSA